MSNIHKRVATACLIALAAGTTAPAVGSAASPAGSFAAPAIAEQEGYIVTFCNLPSTGMAIRAGDNNGATELGRVYNGNVGRVYRTSAQEPSISPGWVAGYGRLTNGSVVHGYFQQAYTCPQ